MARPLIELLSVELVYPIYSLRAQSLRNTLINVAVGGALLRNKHDVVMVRALNNVSLRVEEGDRLGIMGHNGSGKTTLLKVLAGIYEPTQGRVEINGNISSMLDIGHGLDPEATGLQNIKILGHMRGLTGKTIAGKLPDIIGFSDLGNFIELPVKTYSAGMTMRLMFALATAFEPEILLLDEWLGAGDASFVGKATERMNTMVGNSRAMVLASHSHQLLATTCNKLLVLDQGRVHYFGDSQEWFNRPAPPPGSPGS